MDFRTGLIVSIFILVCVSVSGYAIFKTWTLGNKESDFGIVCIGGHEFYRANFAAKGYMANHLDDRGNPVKCSKN